MPLIPPEKFRLYKKGETNPVVEDVSPIAITGLPSGTEVSDGDYFVTGIATVDGQEKESNTVDIPGFKTLILEPRELEIIAISANSVTIKWAGAAADIFLNNKKNRFIN